MSAKTSSRDGRRGLRNVADWPLRRKLALALMVPLLLAATLGGLRVRSDLVEANNYSASADQVTVLRPAVDYLTVAERAMVAAQSGSEKDQAALDAAVKELKSAATRLDKARAGANLTAEQAHQVDVVLDLSRALRDDRTDTLSPGTWVAQLRQLQSGVTQLITTITNAQIEPEPRLEQLAQTLGGRFSLAMQQALVATDRSGATGSLELFSELGVEGAAIDRLAGALGASEPAVAQLRTENAQRSREIRTGGSDLGGAKAFTQYDELITSLMDGIDDQLASSATDARARAFANAAVTGVALLAALLLAFVVSRLLLGPIRKVREGALAVAHVQLPEAVAKIRAGEDPGQIEPIDVSTREEMGQMARAVDDMHRQAVLLASGEAKLRSQVGEMFVTLSRRNTSLINQQLGLIEALEKDEEDPKRLESLFRLDHLASRMRRTADSLLILADAPAPAIGQEDLTVADALQAATAGVQDYQRVRVGATSASRMSSAAAADVVHLLTELVDNALAYSPPNTSVVLSSITGPDGVTVEITDQGLGIPERGLADINQNLRSGGDVTPDTARRMGLFVVSRLAKRHGISVVLTRNEDKGTTATVVLPSAILPDLGGPAAPPAPRLAAVGETTERDPERPTTASTRPVESEDVDSIADRINGALGLPRRQPGTSFDRPVSPAGPPTLPSAAAVPPVAAVPDLPEDSVPEPPADDKPAFDLAAALAPYAARGAGANDREEADDLADLDDELAEFEAFEADLAADDDEPEGADVEVDDADDDVVEDEYDDLDDDDFGHDEYDEHEDEFDDEVDDEVDDEPVVEPVAADRPADVIPFRAPVAPDPVAAAPVAPAEPVAGPVTEVVGEAAGTVAGAVAGAASAPAPTGGLPVRQPAPFGQQPLVAGADALDGSTAVELEPDFDTPIFKSMQSAWLSANGSDLPWSSSEVEAGWDRADTVAEAPVEVEVSASGLPMRRPGTKLVPGGVTKPVSAVARDPEAIRKRLAAHAAGVSRGRSAAASSPHPHTEAGPA